MFIETNMIDDETRLGDDLGMDSQEIVELQCLLEKSLNNKFSHKNILNGKMTIKEIINILESKL